MGTFRDLKVWEKSHQLVLKIYNITKSFPPEEKFGLSSQIRRSAASIPTNIAEGFKRKSNKDFCHFLNMADSSLEETKYHLILAKDLNYIDKKDYDWLTESCEEIGKMLDGLQKRVISFKS